MNFLINTVESLEDKPGLQMIAYKVEADSAELAMQEFSAGKAEVFMESPVTDAVIIGIERLD